MYIRHTFLSKFVKKYTAPFVFSAMFCIPCMHCLPLNSVGSTLCLQWCMLYSVIVAFEKRKFLMENYVGYYTIPPYLVEPFEWLLREFSEKYGLTTTSTSDIVYCIESPTVKGHEFVKGMIALLGVMPYWRNV